MKIKKILIKFWSIKAFVLAFEAAFAFCFFIGIFSNSLNIAPTFTKDRWFYISRGYPLPWSGVTLSKFKVDFPIIKAPFLIREFDGNIYAKIIDLKIFIPLFLICLLIAYPIFFVFSKAARENRAFYVILIPGYILLTAACIFSYFFWFPRI